MKRLSVLLLICILQFAYCKGQTNKYIYYFDANLNPTTKAASVFTGTGNPENGLIKFVCYHNQTNHVVIEAYFTDSVLSTYQGPYRSYFSNSKLESEGNYNNGLQEGIWKKWDSSGHLVDSTMYVHGVKIIASTFGYDEKGRLRSFDVFDIKNNKEQKFVYNDSGNVASEINFTGNTGIIRYYREGKIKLDTVYSKEEIDASFPGGERQWNLFIKLKIEQKIDKLTRDNRSGTCRVRFIVDKEGNVSNVEALTMKGSVLAEVVVNAIKSGPKWNPAMQYGRPVNAYREQPVTFTISEQ